MLLQHTTRFHIPSLPVLTQAQVTIPHGEHLLPPVSSGSLECYGRLCRVERGAELGTERAVSLLLGWVWWRSFQASMEQ